MSFHPRMPYGEGWHKSDRPLPEEGPAFAYSDENRRRFEEFAAHYAPDQRKSAVLHALDQLATDGAEPEIVVFVQCTSPFIAPADLDRAVGMVAGGQADSAFAAVATYEFLWRSGPDGQATGINHDAAYRPRR